jgi:diamine N-acetyltransferase
LTDPVWNVRRADRDDAARLALVGAATFLETFADVLDGDSIVAHCENAHAAAQYREHLDAGASAWLGETANASPVAYALLAAPALPGAREDGSDIELKRIYLLSRFQGTGLGGTLMRVAVDEAARRGAARLLLGVYAHNHRALGFYRKNGFAPIGERKFRVGARDYDDVILARALAS